MFKLALGLIETVGLAGGIEAADAAVKSANVTLLGYELTKGDGMVTVKIEGDVGAVKAAVSAAVSAASKICSVVSSHVIPRPAVGLESLIASKETVGYKKSEPVPEIQPEPPIPEPPIEIPPEPVPEIKPEPVPEIKPEPEPVPEIQPEPPIEIPPQEIPEEPQPTSHAPSEEESPKKKRRKRQKEETSENDEA
jgi:microcompartment protein CcmL/EutN